jgi:histone H3/H4
MPEEMDLVKLNAIKSYAKTVKHMRIADSVANDLRVRANDLLKTILTEATASAKAQDRSTIMAKDVEPVLEKVLGRKNLSPDEIISSVKHLSAIDLGNLSKLLADHLESIKSKKT